MDIPFTGDLTGSWTFVRTTGAEHMERQVYHFMADGSCRGELDMDGKRRRPRFGYRYEGGVLTLVFLGTHNESHYPVTVEPDGAVKVHGPRGVDWCMMRLEEPLPCSIWFVDDAGELRKVGASEGDAGKRGKEKSFARFLSRRMRASIRRSTLPVRRRRAEVLTGSGTLRCPEAHEMRKEEGFALFFRGACASADRSPPLPVRRGGAEVLTESGTLRCRSPFRRDVRLLGPWEEFPPVV